jgi:hypothetical protein
MRILGLTPLLIGALVVAAPRQATAQVDTTTQQGRDTTMGVPRDTTSVAPTPAPPTGDTSRVMRDTLRIHQDSPGVSAPPNAQAGDTSYGKQSKQKMKMRGKGKHHPDSSKARADSAAPR